MAPSCAQAPVGATSPQPVLELRFLDVGQGDAILVRHAGKKVLVDAGETGGIVTMLRALRVDTIDLAVASHNHDDHIGGLDAVLQAFAVRCYLDNGRPANTRIQRRVLELVRDRGVTYWDAGALTDSVIALGDATLRVIPSWMARTRPEVVAISVGAGNTYGLPDEDALAAYGEGGPTVLRTDLDGDTVVTVDGRGCYEVRAGRTGDEARARGGPAAGAVPPTQESSP